MTTRKCAYCGVTYSVNDYSRCPFKCPLASSAAGLYGGLLGLNSRGLTAAGIGQVVGEQTEFFLRQKHNLPVLQYISLQSQVKGLQDLVLSQGKRIAELEEDANKRLTLSELSEPKTA